MIGIVSLCHFVKLPARFALVVTDDARPIREGPPGLLCVQSELCCVVVGRDKARREEKYRIV